jgi:hypothetical protein
MAEGALKTVFEAVERPPAGKLGNNDAERRYSFMIAV